MSVFDCPLHDWVHMDISVYTATRNPHFQQFTRSHTKKCFVSQIYIAKHDSEIPHLITYPEQITSQSSNRVQSKSSYEVSM